MQYIDQGISVIPLQPRSKKPALAWKKYQQRLPTKDEVRDWFDMTDFGMAVVLGRVSRGLTVRDFDAPMSYERWAFDNKGLADELPTVKTRRGAHVYFRSEVDGVKKLADGE